MSGRWHATRWLLALAVVTCVAVPAYGYTWHVSQDGSGDFTVIQDAVEAAAEGDTIMIGPGRYDEFVDVHAPGWTEPAVVWVNKDNLVFIGSGVDVTYVGPETYYDPPGIAPKVFCCIDSLTCTIRNLTVENTFENVYWGGGRLVLEGCRITDYEVGIAAFADGGLRVVGCEFDAGDPDVTIAYSLTTYYPTTQVEVLQCRFTGNAHGVSLQFAENAYLSQNVFIDTLTGITFSNSLGVVEQCVVTGESRQGITIGHNSNVFVNDCSFDSSFPALLVHTGSTAEATGCVFDGGVDAATIVLYESSIVILQGCHIFNGGGFSVKLWYYSGDFIEQNMTNCYWGTTDTDQIDAWIWDQNDDPEIHAIVNFVPIADAPVSIESHTWSEVRSLFQGAEE